MKPKSVGEVIRQTWFGLVVITIVVLVIYSNIYHAPFIFDDVYSIELNHRVRDLSNYSSWEMLFVERPLVEFTFALNYHLGELDVAGYHFVNVLIHIINGFLVYFLSLTIFKRLISLSEREGLESDIHGCNLSGNKAMVKSGRSFMHLAALVTSLIFVAHPIQTQAVTYAVQRFTSMATMFYFLAVLCYIKGRMLHLRPKGMATKGSTEQKGAKNMGGIVRRSLPGFGSLILYILCCVCSVSAFLSKQNTASIVVAIPLVEYFLFDRTWKGWKRKLIWLAPLIVLMGLFILYVSGLFRGGIQFGRLLEDVSGILQAPGKNVSRWVYLCTQFNVIVIYIRLLFFPVGQNLDWLYPFKNSFFEGYTPLAFLVIIGIIGIGIWCVKKRPIIAFGIFWFFLALSIESTIFPIKDSLFEHRLYLPMFGFAIVIAYLLIYALPLKGWGLFMAPFVIIAILSIATFVRNQVWQSQSSMWSDVVFKNPENFRAYYNLGNALYRRGNIEAAVENYFEAVRIEPKFAKAHDNLGVALLREGETKEAVKHVKKALSLRPRDPKILTNYGLILLQQGKLDDAVAQFKKALRIDPDKAQAHNNFAIALARQGSLKDAIVHFSEALRIEPDNAEIHNNLGQALMLRNDLDGAEFHFSEAVRIRPTYAEAYGNLGVVILRQGDVKGGMQHFYKALRIKPDLTVAREGMKRSRQLMGMKGPNQ